MGCSYEFIDAAIIRNTSREEILYEYAKLISRSAYGTLQRGFITDCFKKLRDGGITISGTIREYYSGN